MDEDSGSRTFLGWVSERSLPVLGYNIYIA